MLVERVHPALDLCLRGRGKRMRLLCCVTRLLARRCHSTQRSQPSLHRYRLDLIKGSAAPLRNDVCFKEGQVIIDGRRRAANLWIAEFVELEMAPGLSDRHHHDAV